MSVRMVEATDLSLFFFDPRLLLPTLARALSLSLIFKSHFEQEQRGIRWES